MTIDIIEIIDSQLPGQKGDAGIGVISGGTVNQVLAKNSSSNYDTKWLSLTKSLVGLSNCDNTSDLGKPISTLQQEAFDLKADLVNGVVPNTQLPAFSTIQLGETILTAYRGDRGKIAFDHSQLVEGNPHNVTKSQISLGNVDNTSDLDKPLSTLCISSLAAKADLVLGVVPPSQLSQLYIVTDYANVAAFPEVGSNRTYYKALDSELIYLWGGSTYTSVSGTLGLGTTSTSAFRGDHGLIAYEHVSVVSGNPHAVTKADVGLGNCNNTADMDKPTSSDTLGLLDAKAPKVSPIFTTGITTPGIKITTDAASGRVLFCADADGNAYWGTLPV